MCSLDTCVDDIGACASTGSTIVNVSRYSCATLRYPSKAPSRRGLCDVGPFIKVINLAEAGLNDFVLFNIFDLFQISKHVAVVTSRQYLRLLSYE